MMNNDSVTPNEKEVKSVAQAPNNGAVIEPSDNTTPSTETPSASETNESTATVVPIAQTETTVESEKTPPTAKTVTETPQDPKDDIELTYLNKEFAYDMLSVPSSSYNEQR